MGAALVGNNFLLILWKFHVAWQKKVTCRSLKFTMCREVKAGNERPQGGRQEPAFRFSGASNPRPPRSPQNTGELINELRQRRQKSRF